MKKVRTAMAVSSVVLLIGTLFTGPAAAATAPTLGDTAGFAVLASSTVTNTGPSEVHGELGVSPGTSVTGFPEGKLVPPTLSPHQADDAAADAMAGAIAAYNALAAEPCTQNLTGQDLGGLTLVPGVYCFDSSAFLTGTLTLNAVDGAASVFVFKTGSTLITASDSRVEFLDGGTCNGVYWKVGSSATLGTGSLFEGSIFALASITATTGADVNGRLLALNGAVTLDDNKITGPSCGIESTEPDPDESDTDESESDDSEPSPTDSFRPIPTDNTPTGTTSNPNPTDLSTTGTGTGTPPDAGTSKVTTRTTGAKLITTTHQQLVTTGIDVLPLGLSALTAFLIGAGFLFESRRRTKKEQPILGNIR
jgi:hypothetical protein